MPYLVPALRETTVFNVSWFRLKNLINFVEFSSEEEEVECVVIKFLIKKKLFTFDMLRREFATAVNFLSLSPASVCCEIYDVNTATHSLEMFKFKNIIRGMVNLFLNY